MFRKIYIKKEKKLTKELDKDKQKDSDLEDQ